MKVFHHNDQDGRLSGFIVGHYMKELFPKTEVQFIEATYAKAFPFDTIERNELIFIVDFSLEPEDMQQLLTLTEEVHWIDHHGTAIRKYAQHLSDVEIMGVRSEDEAGCVLTYQYCTEYFTGVRARYVPLFIRLVGDRDIWRYEYGDRSRMFHKGLLSEDTSPTSSIWEEVWKSTKHMEQQGEVVNKVLTQDAKEVFRSGGFWTTFFNRKCFAVNSTIRSSEYFEKLVPDADIWISFRFNGECWIVSLYSVKYDVSKLAEKFQHNGRRGGGHKGAAGFSCYYPPFLPSAKEVSKARMQKEVASSSG